MVPTQGNYTTDRSQPQPGMDAFFAARQAEDQRYRFARHDLDLANWRRALAAEIEHDAAWRLAQLGYHVRPAGNNTRWDLVVEDALHVEIKAATWHGRFQASIHNLADLYLFCCVNGKNHYFVIPRPALGARRNIAIWSPDPGQYSGQWSAFYERWDTIPAAIAAAVDLRPFQLSLFQQEDTCQR